MIKIIIIKKSKSSSLSTSSTSSTRNRWQQGSYYCSTTDDQRDDGVASFWQWRWGLFGYNWFTFFLILCYLFYLFKERAFSKNQNINRGKSIILEWEIDSHPLEISLSYPKPNLRWIPPIWFPFFLLFCEINVINDFDYGFQFSNPCNKQTLFGYHLKPKLSFLTDYNKLLNFICILI